MQALVYKDKGPHQRAGGTYDYKLVTSGQELDDAFKDGWYASLPEAIDGKTTLPEIEAPEEDNAPPTREELEAKAIELGIKFDGRTGDKKLSDLIAAKV